MRIAKHQVRPQRAQKETELTPGGAARVAETGKCSMGIFFAFSLKNVLFL